MNYPDLSKKVQDHLLAFFHSRRDPAFLYHNLAHTQSVVKAAIQIANHYQLNERDFFIVNTAAWFHDTGYFDDYNHHEKRGGEMAASFLQKLGVDSGTIQEVVNCIQATRMPQNATSRLEEIVCDSDLFHLGSDDFPDWSKLMRKETELKKGISISKDEWRKKTIELFETHHYYTDYCQLLLNDQKRENLERLKHKVTETEEKRKVGKNGNDEPIAGPAIIISDDPILLTPEENLSSKKKKSEGSRPDRGIETMFRITSNNNQRLSDMADNKAHIMITVNSIILSAIISLLLRKLDDNTNLVIPTYLILTVSVLTIIFSILATRPSLPSGRFSASDITEKKVNLLFFGNFYKMNLAEYAAGMQEVMNDRDFLYGTLIKDVYSQGVVLGRKYRLLRISYNIFMFGLIISVLAFVVATFFAIK